MIIDALGNPIAATLTPGQQSDLSQAAPLLEELEPGAFLADKAYDVFEGVRSEAANLVSEPVAEPGAGLRE